MSFSKEEIATATFEMCVAECLDTPELMTEYRRLYGGTVGLAVKRAPIERMVDEACGHAPTGASDEEWRAFFDFVRRCVWHPWLAQMSAEREEKRP